METIGQILMQATESQAQRIISGQSNSGHLSRLESVYQAKQIENAKDFQKAFPSEEKLIRTFCPAYWSYYMERKMKCLTAPCITLKMVAEVYGNKELAATLVQNNMTGIYKVSTAKDEAGQKALEGIRLGAQMFVSKHGATCSLYAMMIYFASYLADYKSNYASFDIQDIIRQYGQKFLPSWNGLVERALKEQEKERQERFRNLEPVGNKALLLYVRDCLGSDYDIRKGYLYRKGVVTEEIIAEAERMKKEGIF